MMIILQWNKATLLVSMANVLHADDDLRWIIYKRSKYNNLRVNNKSAHE